MPFLFEWVCSVCSEALLHSIAFVFLAALAVYTRSPAAYEGLKSFKPLQLPSVDTLKHHVGANPEDAGGCTDRLEQERRQYLVIVEEKRRALDKKRQKKKNQSGTVYTVLQ